MTGKANISSCEDLQQKLDDALADTFPASDPVSLVTFQGEDFWENYTPCDPANNADGGERDSSGVKKPT